MARIFIKKRRKIFRALIFALKNRSKILIFIVSIPRNREILACSKNIQISINLYARGTLGYLILKRDIIIIPILLYF